MRLRSFGDLPIQVSEIGLGCGRISPYSGGMRFETARAVIGRSLDRGVTFFDTADSYGAGWGERWLGRALGATRGEVIVATKCGLPASMTGKLAARALPAAGRLAGLITGRHESRYNPSYIRSAAVGSLRRLGTDYLDVLMLHNPPTAVLTAGDWAEAMTALQEAGQVHHTGISARTSEDAAIAIQDFSVDCIELELNACTLSGAQPTLDLAAKHGTAVIARQVLGSGSLLNAVAARMETAGWTGPKRDIAAALVQIVLENPAISVALMGMGSVDQVDWNTTAGELPPGFVAQVRSVARDVC